MFAPVCLSIGDGAGMRYGLGQAIAMVKRDVLFERGDHLVHERFDGLHREVGNGGGVPSIVVGQLPSVADPLADLVREPNSQPSVDDRADLGPALQRLHVQAEVDQVTGLSSGALLRRLLARTMPSRRAPSARAGMSPWSALQAPPRCGGRRRRSSSLRTHANMSSRV